jgi:hypothetical protein
MLKAATPPGIVEHNTISAVMDIEKTWVDASSRWITRRGQSQSPPPIHELQKRARLGFWARLQASNCCRMRLLPLPICPFLILLTKTSEEEACWTEYACGIHVRIPAASGLSVEWQRRLSGWNLAAFSYGFCLNSAAMRLSVAHDVMVPTNLPLGSSYRSLSHTLLSRRWRSCWRMRNIAMSLSSDVSEKIS